MPTASHPSRPAPNDGPLARLAEFGARLAGTALTCTPCPCCDGAVMLIVETAAPAGDGADPAMWVVSPAACGRLALEAVVNETRFDLLAIGPAERILTLLEALAAPAKVNA